MPKIQLKKLQTAQGMVEFALVLPILLLLILGIFAFGHLFFSYSSVVSASREAARWGAAVGEAPSAFPRYQDCDAIRAAAVRVGTFAGVAARDFDPTVPFDPSGPVNDQTGVAIAFDHGPDPDTGASDPYAYCAGGSEGGPADVQMGDRIVVTVRVNYTPIVPVVNIPSFPLEASTFRTILRSVPVGEAPTAVDPCTTATTITLSDNGTPVGYSKVGEFVIYSVQVTAVDHTKPTGAVRINEVLDDGSEELICTHDMTEAMNGVYSCEAPGKQYLQPGIKTIRAYFDSDNTCQLNSHTGDPDPDYTHTVDQAPSIVTYGVNPPTGHANERITITATVAGNPPIGITPAGWVIVHVQGQPDQRADLTNGIGIAGYTLPAGNYNVWIEYPDEADPIFGPYSTPPFNITVLSATPTYVFTPTATVPAGAPTKTPLPDYCPYLTDSNYNLFQVGSAIEFSVTNPNVSAASAQNITSVELSWPSDPAAYIQEIRWGQAVDSCTTTGNDKNCLWQNSSGLGPTHQVISSSTAGWDAKYDDLAKGSTKLMRMVFNHSMPMGPYHLIIRFSENNCQIEIDRDKVTP